VGCGRLRGRRGFDDQLPVACSGPARVFFLVVVVFGEEGFDFTLAFLGLEARLFVEEGQVFFVGVVGGVPWLRLRDVARDWPRVSPRFEFLERTRRRRRGRP
jgi:hypothetical protein